MGVFKGNEFHCVILFTPRFKRSLGEKVTENDQLPNEHETTKTRETIIIIEKKVSEM